jgi:hypothetical protein
MEKIIEVIKVIFGYIFFLVIFVFLLGSAMGSGGFNMGDLPVILTVIGVLAAIGLICEYAENGRKKP